MDRPLMETQTLTSPFYLGVGVFEPNNEARSRKVFHMERGAYKSKVCPPCKEEKP